MTNSRTLRSDDPIAVDLTAALEQGEVERLRQLLTANAWLACCVVESAKGGSVASFCRLARAEAECCRDRLDACTSGRRLACTSCWHVASRDAVALAASNDDVALMDALLDAGASIEVAGSSIDGGSPLSCAVGYGQWAAARRLVERGARTLFWHEAALGLMPSIMQRVQADP